MRIDSPHPEVAITQQQSYRPPPRRRRHRRLRRCSLASRQPWWKQLPLRLRHRLWFAYLMANGYIRTKTHSHIGKDNRPLRKLKAHNLNRVRNAKSTRPASGHWKVEMIIGPFDSKTKVLLFRHKWKRKSRGIIPRRLRGIKLARRLPKSYGVRVYDRCKGDVPLLARMAA